MKKVLFIDRDGTLLVEPEDEQIDSLSKFNFIPGAITNLHKIVSNSEYELVMISNQDGLGTASFPEATFWPVQNLLVSSLEGEGIKFTDILIDRSLISERKPTRKPGIALMGAYQGEGYNLTESIVIGDRESDLRFAENLGAKCILINPDLHQKNINSSSLIKLVANWSEISEIILHPSRKAIVHRTSNETTIRMEIDLDGTGEYNIQTELGFLDHMLEQIARHAQIDLHINVQGDLEIDEHHTVEDTALVLGEAFLKAMGDKRGMERFGYCLPMDDALAQVAIDFGGRPWLVWDAEFKREKIGDVPTEMFYHFFKSFTETAKCNLNIKVEGVNEHHKIESVFKAFSKSLKMAVKRDGYKIPTTKGLI